MNEKTNPIIGYVLCFVLGVIITGGVGYFTIVGPGIRRTGQLRSELATATELNRVIESGLNQASTIIRSSDNSITKLRNILTVLRDTEQMVESRNSSSGSNSNR